MPQPSKPVVEITSQTPGLCRPGIFAVEDVTTGKQFLVGTANIRKRYWDNRNWLERGLHKNRQLQRDWTARSADFRFVLVQFVCVPGMLAFVKQLWIDSSRDSGRCYNQKNGVPKRRNRPLPLCPVQPVQLDASDVNPNRRADLERRLDDILRLTTPPDSNVGEAARMRAKLVLGEAGRTREGDDTTNRGRNGAEAA